MCNTSRGGGESLIMALPGCSVKTPHLYGFSPPENARDVIWNEDQSLLRTGNAPWVMSAITNLVITLFRIHGVTRYKEETRRNAEDPRRTLRLLGLSPG